MEASGKLCTSTRVICGKKGSALQVTGGTVIKCRNQWGCRYQIDLTDYPKSWRRKGLRAALIN